MTTNTSSSTNGTRQNTTTTPTAPVDPLVFGCSCEVEFSGLCPAFNPNAPVDEAQCDASNRPQITKAPVNSGCKYQYDYLVAVVATNKDASYLLQLQSYQNAADASSFLSMSLAMILAMAASVLLFF